MSKHTPGQWKVSCTKEFGAYGIWTKRNNPICTFDVTDESTREQRDANARLIAAAPDLLEACQLALDILTLHNLGLASAAKAIRDAIAKATSEVNS